MESIGPYRIVDVLGEGNTGVVYLAESPDRGRRVAVKTVRVDHAPLLQSIRREIRALARLRHPGIVAILDDGVDHGVPWYAMEHLVGETLRQRLAGPDPLKEKLAVLGRLCSPLAYLHGEGVVHRDLKPDNVFLRESGVPVLVDFGIASRFGGDVSRDQLEVGGRISGTVAYMAPEQARGEVVDARADLYSLGCILYELIAGRPPFVGATAAQVLRQHMRDEPAPPSHFRPESTELDSLVLRLLAKDPHQRIGHAEDVAAALGRMGIECTDPPASPRPRPYLYRPRFVGRAAPIAELEKHLAAAGRGVGRLVLVAGESGAGKTRLVLELAHEAHRHEAYVLTGDCVALGGPLHPLRPVLLAVADRCRERGPSETQRLLGSHLDVLGVLEPALFSLPGAEGTAPAIELAPDAARRRLFAALFGTIAALATGPLDSTNSLPKPFLLILDDIQWADELTLGFLEALARPGQMDRLPILVVAAYRSEESPEMFRRWASSQTPGSVHHLELGRLDASAVTAIAGDMLGVAPPAGFIETLSRHSEGNPFFVAETLRMAISEDLLSRDQNGLWSIPTSQHGADGIGALHLPKSLRELVGRRLQNLSAPARALAEAAAIVGRELTFEVLAAMDGGRSENFDEGVDELIRRHVLEITPRGSLRFVHDRIREALDSEVFGPRRGALHRSAAEALEANQVAHPGEVSADLGRHWEHAGEAGRAREHYLAAARRAKESAAYADAERLYRAYLRLVEQPTTESVAARTTLAAHILAVQGQSASAREEHSIARAEAETLGDRSAQALSLRMLGDLHRIEGSVAEARRCFDQALQLALEAGDRREEGRTLAYRASLELRQGNWDASRTDLHAALQALRDSGERRGEGMALHILAVLEYRQAHHELAQSLYQQALDCLRDAGDRRGASHVLVGLAHIDQDQGNIEAARAKFEQALANDREMGDRVAEAISRLNLAELASLQGRVEEAEAFYSGTLSLAQEGKSGAVEAMALRGLANLRRDRDPSWSQSRLERALVLSRQGGDRQHEGVVLNALASLQHEQGRFEIAREFHEQTLSLARALGFRQLEGLALVGLARLERHLGRGAAAETNLAAAEALRGAGLDRIAGVLALCERGHQSLQRGEPPAADLEQAVSTVLSMGAGPKSPLSRAVARLQRAQATFDAGRTLIAGERPEDLPEAVVAGQSAGE